MNTYNKLGTVSDWQSKKALLEAGRPTNRIILDENSNGLKALNAKNGRFLDKAFKRLSATEDFIKKANQEYDSLMEAVDSTMRAVGRLEENGSVNADSSSSSYTAQGSVTSALTSDLMGEKPTRDDAMLISGVPDSSLSSSVKEAEAVSAAAAVGAVSGGNIGASSVGAESTSQAILTSATSGTAIGSSGSLAANNAFGDRSIGSGTWTKLSSGEQVNLVGKLQSVGYTRDEIKAIVTGEASVPLLEVDALAVSLENGLSNNPELRVELENKYGFDIFNEDGSVDQEKLGLALMIDDKNDEDDYDLIRLLHSKYGIDIVDQNEYEHLFNMLSELGDNFEQIRAELLERYGFDIFNKDRSINRDRLTLAILMDKKNANDEFDLLEFLRKVYENEKNVDVKTGAISTLSGVGLLGVAASGAVALANKQEKENEDAKEEIDAMNQLNESIDSSENSEDIVRR